jgi:hypothetical protein
VRARILGVVLIQAPRLWGAASNFDIGADPADEPVVDEPELGGATPEQTLTQAAHR